MKRILLWALLLAPMVSTGASGGEYEHYSEWMTASEMGRITDPCCLSTRTSTPKWNYDGAIELEAMLDTYERYPAANEAIKKYADRYAEFMIADDGGIYGYKMEDYTLDRVRPGMVILRLYRLNRRQQDSLAVETLLDQMDTHPRTKAGPWWHKLLYHDQVWLDGLYMGLPVRMAAARQFRPAEAADYCRDAVRQLAATDSCTYDSATDLWRHGWDESRTLFWADKTTGRSQHAWGRAMGWYAMALMEVLDELPADDEGRDTLISIFRHCMTSVVKCQDKESGVWHDVLDVTDSRNYLEATCSAMFTYALLKGARLGYLDATCQAAGIRAYRGLVSQFVRRNTDGTISLRRCCSAAGLGPESNTSRNGSFEYYISESIVTDDPKGIGPFIRASLEMERMGYTVDNLNEHTGIAVHTAEADGRTYTLGGCLTDSHGQTPLRSGIYIRNGKKVAVGR